LYAKRSTHALDVILVGVWFNSLAYVPFSLLVAQARSAAIARIHLLEVGPYVVLGAVVTAKFGIVGAAGIWSARVAVDMVVFFTTADRRALMIGKGGLIRICKLGVLMAILFLLFVLVAASVTSLLGRIAVGGAALGCYALVAYRYVLTDGETRLLGDLAISPMRAMLTR
jgi:O-antigen/teichoic acid export membrane protein